MNSRFARFAAVIVLLCCINGIPAGDVVGQTKPEDAQNQTIKVRTELVEVRTVVTDRQGHIIENLNKDDFDLLENNQPQEISFFSISRLEDKPSQDKAAEPKSLREQLSEAPARTTVLYVDNLHLSFSSLNWVKHSLRRFISEKMTPQDMIALVTSSGTLGISQQFTRDRQILRYAIEQISMGPISLETNFTGYLAGRIALGDRVALEEGKKIWLSEGIDDKSGSMTRARANRILNEESYLRESALLTLKALIEQMSGMPGQRMVAIFSEGFTMHGRDGWVKYDDVRSVINSAARSGVVIYSIDAKGLDAGPVSSDPNGFVTAGQNEKLDGLSSLAKDTGGEMYMNTNNLSGALGQAFDANRSYYVLAYYLKPSTDRQFRSIKVRVRNHPEYNIRTPKGFSPSDMIKMEADATEKMPQQRLLRAINAPLSTTNFGVSARMDFVEAGTDSQQVALTVHIEGDKFQYREQDQRHLFTVEILYAIYDSAGQRVDALSANVQGALTPERLAQGQTNGYLFSRRLTLKPGVYQARVGVREVSTDRIGTTSAWIEVPDLARNKLALSSLLLLDPHPVIDGPVDDGNAGELKRIRLIQGVRLYPRNSICGYVLRVYHNAKTPVGSNLALRTELMSDGKSIQQSQWLPLSMNNKDVDSKGQIYVGGKVDLGGLKPGVYELTVSVKDARSKKTARRTAVIGVE